MGVYIKNMEMPKSCGECPLYEHLSIHGNAFRFCRLTRMETNPIEKRDDCPLIELPKHGRLIDADELKASIQSSDTDEYQILSTKQLHDQLDKWIDGRETIIEAEGEDDSN